MGAMKVTTLCCHQTSSQTTKLKLKMCKQKQQKAHPQPSASNQRASNNNKRENLEHCVLFRCIFLLLMRNSTEVREHTHTHTHRYTFRGIYICFYSFPHFCQQVVMRCRVGGGCFFFIYSEQNFNKQAKGKQ